ncbi:hypothetical protein [Stygiolobus caldivivus]|uniref:Uncharacterized protein n=1 Tax=Stygiolobus caldivivus TaxID=2824673 RepID=A0A8D5ZIE9_9CREN|nr:hypothetical protein [Stygiolobus caldivivus]BCU69360.1 hypothetical protein KN1_06570 [Stygiolobus caldivivus]
MNTKLLAVLLIISVLANVYLAYLLSHVIQTQYLGFAKNSSTVSQTSPTSVKSETLSFTRSFILVLKHDSRVSFNLVTDSNVTYVLVIITLIHEGHHKEELLILTNHNTSVIKEFDKGVYKVSEEFSIVYSGYLNESQIYVNIQVNPND